MTREEAIKDLEVLKDFFVENSDAFPLSIEYAIKALEQEPCEDWYDVSSNEMNLEQARQAVRDLRKKLEHLWQEPCEDAVSRAEIIQELNRLGRNAFKDDTDYDNFFAFVDSLSSVTPQEPRKGHWIYQTSDDYLGELNRYYECSECGRTVGDTVGDIYTEYPYCHCGAKMIKDGEK